MLFRGVFRRGLLDGSITLTFRRWTRPRVRPGGRYRLDGDHVLEVDSIRPVRAGRISSAEARRSGFPDRRALMAELGRRTPLAPNDTVHRVAFHVVRETDERRRIASRGALADGEALALARRLDRMDALSRHGPWTRPTLSLIERHPRTAASQLAKRARRETARFKTDVRKLKALGLTMSFDIGYELSPRGRAFLDRERRS